MKPAVIFLIGSAGSGKSTAGKLLAAKYNLVYLDKDTVCNHFTGMLLQSNGYSPFDRDGCDFYQDTVMELEYRTLLDVANSNLELGLSVILDAPFIKYFSNKDYIVELKSRYGWEHVHPLVLQVTVDFPVLKERLRLRGLERDAWKLAHWDEYVQSVQEKQCLWDGIEIFRFDNSAAAPDEVNLHNWFEKIREQRHRKDE
ncbi:AAA family ATPase [Paenibacillus hamazuiensis]|uniref:AAA family ATPase n=1 Tax=Paenibacillus hamazuiensis TaxID=2936508 RepID=UPI00200C2891|nr:AAA family ATPase [Paenibacillus hamazuiensis]